MVSPFLTISGTFPKYLTPLSNCSRTEKEIKNSQCSMTKEEDPEVGLRCVDIILLAFSSTKITVLTKNRGVRFYRL
jgi:hypothetical protein